jgi:serine-type D-Ala-D-Ala carboxypeptidase (penicillin-binding protein 5/6)
LGQILEFQCNFSFGEIFRVTKSFATIQVYQNNQLIRTIQIEDHVEIEEANLFQKFFTWLQGLFGLFSDNTPSVKLYPLDR